MSMSTQRGFRQALEQRQRLGQRGQAAVQLLGLSFEEAIFVIDPASTPRLRRFSPTR